MRIEVYIGVILACYTYSRVSSSDQVEGTSLDDQRNKTRGAAMMNGMEMKDEAYRYRDIGYT